VIADLCTPTFAQQVTDGPVVIIHGTRDPVQRYLDYIAKDQKGDIQVTEAANLRALADAAGYDPACPAHLRFIVPPTVTIMGKPGGGAGIETGSWPMNADIFLVIKGNVYGGGGNGGQGGPIPQATNGGGGGDAIRASAPVTIAIIKGAQIRAGGGGGGGGNGNALNGGNGSGGGGGFPNGLGGKGAAMGEPGRDATKEWGGRGGNNRRSPGGDNELPPSFVDDKLSTSPSGPPIPQGYGGNGGGAALDGQPGQAPDGRPGGLAGYAIRANGFDVKLVNGGSLGGQVG
jgi:hypothetical protein